jgi:hypothetical protein
MKDWKFASTYFYFLVKTAAVLSLSDCGIRILYVCGRVNWLEWSITGAYLNILGFLLLIGFPWWLGIRCRLCSQRSVFLFGILLSTGVGSINNLVSTLQWFFLMACSSDIYATDGGRAAIVISWLALPVVALLGGVVAWIGRKWSQKIKMP